MTLFISERFVNVCRQKILRLLFFANHANIAKIRTRQKLALHGINILTGHKGSGGRNKLNHIEIEAQIKDFVSVTRYQNWPFQMMQLKIYQKYIKIRKCFC